MTGVLPHAAAARSRARHDPARRHRWRGEPPRFSSMPARECEWFRGRVAADPRATGSSCRFDGPARAIRCATALAKAAERFCVTVRAGLHTGECAVEDGVLTGPPIEIAAAIAAWAGTGRSPRLAHRPRHRGRCRACRSTIGACTASATRGSGGCSGSERCRSALAPIADRCPRGQRKADGETRPS